MKELLELTEILSKNAPQKIEVLDQQSLRKSSSKYAAFWEGLQQRLFQNDAEAAVVLYGTPVADDRYRQFKSRFKRKLLNTFFFLDAYQAQTGDLDTTLGFCRRQLVLVQLLKTHGALHAAVVEAVQIQSLALKHSLAGIVVQTAAVLREIYALQGNKKEFETQHQLIEQFQPRWNAEIQAEGCLQSIRLACHGTPRLSDAQAAQVAQWCDELLSLTEQFDLPIVSLAAFEAWMLRFETEGNYQALEETGAQADNWLAQHPAWAGKDNMLRFALLRLRAALYNLNFKTGRAIAEQALKMPRLTPNDRMAVMELLLLLSIHTDSLLHVFAVYKEATEHKAFQKTTAELEAKWHIFTVYVHLLMRLKPMSQQLMLSQKKKAFDVESFMQASIPLESRQENQTILLAVAQIVFLLQAKLFDQAAEQIEWLGNLANTLRYKEDFARQAAFIKLLNQLRLNNFKVQGLKKTEAPLRTLHEIPFRYNGQLHHLEVIPYPKLWELILSLLS